MNLLDKPVLTVEEAGKVLRISRDAAYAAVHRGEIPVIRIGRTMRVPSAKLRELLGEQQPA